MTFAASNRSRRGPPRAFLATLATASLLLATAAGGRNQADFAEPKTGRRVSEYSAELPINPTQRRDFAIPGDCAELLRIADRGPPPARSIIDRQLWRKVESDCRYSRFLNRHPLVDMRDFVSGYDFMNANLCDLPITQRCEADGDLACTPGAPRGIGMLRPFPAEPPDGSERLRMGDQCELRDGVFRGRLYFDRQGVHCEPGAGSSGLRLIAVDLADINGDRVLDAVLRFIPIGPGATRLPLTLPVTRDGPDEPFTVPRSEPPPVLEATQDERDPPPF